MASNIVGKHKQPITHSPIAEAIAEFLACQIRNPNTREGYGRDIAAFSGWCEQQGLTLADIRPLHIALYLETMGDKANVTVNRALSALRGLFSYLKRQGVITDNPAEDVRGVRSSSTEGKTNDILAEDLAKFFKAIRSLNGESRGDRTFILQRDLALFSCLFHTWSRVTPITKLKLSDYISTANGRALKFVAKAGKDRVLLLHPGSVDHLEAYIKGCKITGKDKPLFRGSVLGPRWVYQPTAKGITRAQVLMCVKKYAEYAGIPYSIGCHSFRVAGASTFVEAGGDVVTAQQQLGHADLATTMAYVRRRRSMQPNDLEKMPTFD